ncbi:flap endonuclease-1 [Candidatus Woesearchaeota archaeon]|nr:flap endonuclease-1 [Candidatus Woesearchaeota archaeon]
MGTQLSSIITAKEISVEDLRSKKLAIDSFNLLYQFLSTIRQRDGTPLKDSYGNITSHLSGLFFRTTKLMKEGIKLAFVFDGKAPELKREERERRKELKEEAMRKYESAVEQEDVEMMRKYAKRTAVLTTEMIDESKELITALGLPIVQAASEGEAQAAYMVKKGDFYGIVSQDTDGLLFGSTKIIKNLSITGKRKKPGTSVYYTVNPEIITLSEVLNTLSIDNDQLIVIGMLCGTDFNIGGIKGIGPKKALDLVKKHGKDFDSLFEEAKWDDFFDYSWKDVFKLFKEMPVKEDYEIKWGLIDKGKVIEILHERHEFSKERIENSIDEIVKNQKQKGLGEWF